MKQDIYRQSLLLLKCANHRLYARLIVMAFLCMIVDEMSGGGEGDGMSRE